MKISQIEFTFRMNNKNSIFINIQVMVISLKVKFKSIIT